MNDVLQQVGNLSLNTTSLAQFIIGAIVDNCSINFVENNLYKILSICNIK